MIGWSRLVQIVTVDPFTCPEGSAPLPEDDEPELRHADVISIATPTAAHALNKLGPRMVLLL